jgi:hypothetical protein
MLGSAYNVAVELNAGVKVDLKVQGYRGLTSTLSLTATLYVDPSGLDGHSSEWWLGAL